jgi:hypothetical protein
MYGMAMAADLIGNENEMLKNADKAQNLASAANFEFGLSEKEVLGEAFQLRN